MLTSIFFFFSTVGGIYTVIKTKAPVTCQEYGDRYTLIGPLSYKSAPMEVEAIEWDKPSRIGDGERFPFSSRTLSSY
jgi:glycogen(starch) synthase